MLALVAMMLHVNLDVLGRYLFNAPLPMTTEVVSVAESGTVNGLGSDNDNLPSFIVLVSAGQGGQPLYSRLWGSGFLDSRHQGVRFRSGSDPVLYLSNPKGISTSLRRRALDRLLGR